MKRIAFQQISIDAFEPFGSTSATPSGPPLASDATFKYWSDVAKYEIDGETEIGYCTVYRQEDGVVNWMERHARTPEILIPIDVAFVLPVMSDDGEVQAFRAKPGEAVVIGQGVWHSACKPVDADEASYFVIFRRGTPQEDVIKTDIEPVTLGQI